MKPIIFATCAALAAVTPALANDSAASLAAGGLTLTRSADIAMRSEDLAISPKLVEVRYVFVNAGARDQTVILAFPLPDIPYGDRWEEPKGAMTGDPVNFVNFKLWDNGKPVAVKVEQRAVLKGRDVTRAVKAAGLPVNFATAQDAAKLDALEPAVKAQLKADGVLLVDGDYVRPEWTVKTKFYWMQTFPAGKPVALRQRYQPVSGGTFFARQQLEPGGGFVGPFCMDAGTRAAAAKLLAKGTVLTAGKAEPGLVGVSITDYILRTANNWKGPIGRFHLTLDKLKPQNVISLCWKGALKKTGPTRFEATETNFSPRQDIHMMVLQ